MRITGGQYKNRKLVVPEGKDVRPTSDRMRQTLFNMIRHARWADDFDLDGAYVLDLFCGSGALGIEALSQGAKHCTFVDMDVTSIKSNASAILPNDDFETIKTNAVTFKPRNVQSYDLVFMDPPYNKDLIEPAIQNLIQNQTIKQNCLIIAESEKGYSIDINHIEVIETRTQGQSSLHILRYNPTIESVE